MANTLQEQMLADTQSGGVFSQRNGQGFDEPLTHYPGGDVSAGETVYGTVDADLEDAGGVGSGEGPRIDTPVGVKLRRNALLELPLTVTVSEKSGTAQRRASLFDFWGYRWRTVRITGRDAGMQTVLVTRVTRIATRRVVR